MTEPVVFTDANGDARVRDAEVVCPIIVGTIAWYLGKKTSTEFVTHKWVLYLRGANNQDLSYCIKRCTFHLHPSFATPLRLLDQQPFEVQETGWGEFEVLVQLTFHDDCHEKDVELIHKLKLYADNEHTPQSTKKPVVSEEYEELIFSEPTEALWRRATEQGVGPAPDPPLSVLPHLGAFNPQDDLRRIHTSRQRIERMKGPQIQNPAAIPV